jgi:hypothetical protein
MELVIYDPKRRLPEKVQPGDVHAGSPLPTTLQSDPLMLFAMVGTLKLSEPQIMALRRPVEDREIEWRPLEKGGPPAIPYLSHNGCRDRLDACFGLGGWGMAPMGQPKEKDGIIYVPYALVVDGLPRIFAWGEQAYHANNKQMTYGDALEGAKSNAITRCGKELGVGRELWNRKHLEELKARMLPERLERSSTSAPSRRPAGSDAWRDESISPGQRKRLWVIVKKSGRNETLVRDWLLGRYNLTSTSDIKRRDYDAICKMVEAPGPLPIMATGDEG